MRPEDPDGEKILRGGLEVQGGHLFLGRPLRARKSKPITLMTATATVLW
jgi:hypothetical protein